MTTAYHIATPGKTLRGFPRPRSLASWASDAEPVVESSAPNQGRYVGTFDTRLGREWLIFEGATQPPTKDEAVAVWTKPNYPLSAIQAVITSFHESGQDPNAMPLEQSLADWATYRTPLLPSAAPDEGEHHGTIDTANGNEYAIFLGNSQPASWDEAVAVWTAEGVTLLSRTWSGALLEAGESYSWPVDYPIEVTDPEVSVKVNGVEVATATASGTGTSFVFVFAVPAGVALGDTVLVETAEDQPRAVVTGQVVEADASESFAAEVSVEVVKGLTGNPVVLTQPVSPDGQIVGPLVIGDDYLAINQRALMWTIPPIPGVTPATATTQLGFSHTRHGGVEVSGTVADNGDDTWTLIFGIESSDTEDAIKPGEYSWSVQVTSSDGKKITRVRNRDDCYRVRWVEKQTS